MALAESLLKSQQKYRQEQIICAALKFTLSGDFSKQDVEAYSASLNVRDPSDPIYIPAGTLVAALREEGVNISPSSIDRHRRRSCSCYRVGA